MRDLGGGETIGRTGGARLAAPSLEEIETFTARLEADAGGLDDAERVDRIAALDRLRCATEAASAETVADFVLSQRQAASDRGVPAARRDRGLALQIALARRVSPRRGQQDLSLALVLRTELPHTRAAFRAGRLDGYRATLIARETACLSAEHRAAVDELLCAEPKTVETLSPRQLVGRLTKAAAALDPASLAERRRRAEADRHTTLRPAPDTMAWLGALLPVKDGVAVHATLGRDARRAKAAGDPRSIGQLMADILVQRVVHPGSANAATDAAATEVTWSSSSAVSKDVPAAVSTVPVTVNLIVRDDVLLGEETGTGWVDGYGPVPGDLIRQWIADNLDTAAGAGAATWLRRVYEQPATGHLVAMDPKARLLHGGLAEFLRIRDRVCRTPGCDAPVRHCDHVVPRSRGGPTTADNGQGLCESCNYAKEADGWTTRVVPGPRHTIEITTPTGHTYATTAEEL